MLSDIAISKCSLACCDFKMCFLSVFVLLFDVVVTTIVGAEYDSQQTLFLKV